MTNATVNLRSVSEESQAKAPRPPRLARTLSIIAGAAIIIYAGSVLASGMAWRAVFLANNQVYFGHFWDVPFSGTITLHDVYYLQVTLPAGEQLSGQDQSQLKLVKLGNEIHGPTGEMVIPISQVLFWETLRSNSVIVQTIQNGQNGQTPTSK